MNICDEVSVLRGEASVTQFLFIESVLPPQKLP